MSICWSIFLFVVGLSVCLSICWSVCLSVFVSVCLFICWSICLFVICLSVCLYLLVYMSVSLSVHPVVFFLFVVCLFVCLSVCPFIGLSVCLPVPLCLCLGLCLPVCLSLSISLFVCALANFHYQCCYHHNTWLFFRMVQMTVPNTLVGRIFGLQGSKINNICVRQKPSKHPQTPVTLLICRFVNRKYPALRSPSRKTQADQVNEW